VARGFLARGSSVLPKSSVVTTATTTAPSRWITPVAAASLAGTTTSRGMATSVSGGSLLSQLATENPYKDVVRYEFKNRKWNLQHVDYYSEALAIGLLENGLQPGDVVLSWLHPHFSESVSVCDLNERFQLKKIGDTTL
jgi:hypothetical protein